MTYEPCGLSVDNKGRLLVGLYESRKIKVLYIKSRFDKQTSLRKLALSKILSRLSVCEGSVNKIKTCNIICSVKQSLMSFELHILCVAFYCAVFIK